MCGIAGIISLAGEPLPDLARRLAVMTRLLAHRGPDDRGTWMSPSLSAGFSHRRLSIFDLSPAGHQPMLGQDGSVVVHNGEIYNFPELRTALSAKWKFRTSTDTEVILAAHAVWGADAVSHFRGMFAFARWDDNARTLRAARDRLGVKPFYYTVQEQVLYFASEMKALLPFLGTIETDPDAFAEYVTFQYTLGAQTLFKYIRSLQPGHHLIVENGHVREQRYWDIHYNVDTSASEHDSIDRLGSLVSDAIRLHTRSDVPIGTYLSGGLDSSLIALLAADRDKSGMPAFHGKFSEHPSFDESGYARIAASAANCIMHELDITPRMFSDHISDVLYHLDTPVAGPGAFPQFMVAKLASQHVKVCLGGQGGDEVFGGYARYLAAYLEQCIRAAIDGTYNAGHFVVTLESIIPRLGMLREYKPMLAMLWREGLFGPLDERYFRLINRSEDMSSEIRLEELNLAGVFETYRKEFNGDNVGAEAYFDKMTHFDLKFLLPALLQVEDRMSMAHGLESRVPLVDHPIVEYTASIPANIKYKAGEAKYILKEAFRNVLPKQLLERRDKMGFPVPMNQWFGGELRDWAADIFGSASAQERGYINRASFSNLANGEAPFSRKTWGLMSLELWHQQFHDQSQKFSSMLKEAELSDTEKWLPA